MKGDLEEQEAPAGRPTATGAPGGLRYGVLDLLPDFTLPSTHYGPINLAKDQVGKKLLLLFLPDPRPAACRAQLERFAGLAAELSEFAHIYAVVSTPLEVNSGPDEAKLPFPLLSDAKREVAAGLGVRHNLGPLDNREGLGAFTVLIADENRRILRIDSGVSDPDHADTVLRFFRDLPRREPRRLGGFAPVLHVPKVFEPEFCDLLIERYLTQGNDPSPSVKLVDGAPVEHLSPNKVRRDHPISDPALIGAISEKVGRRVLPEIAKAFTRVVTGVQEYKVVCYEAEDHGCFKPHRDNVMAIYAYRRFALSVNLNTGEYEGGVLRFPEYGPDEYRPDRGDALVYSSSLMHEVTPVTAGRRFSLVAHMFDEESHKLHPAHRG